MLKFDQVQFEKEILTFWKESEIFLKSLSNSKKEYVFFEGPPSANGLPGIHHMYSRTIKDAFCRYKTMNGFYVKRKAGWDTHGLPVELQVEKLLNIKKTDIGNSISIEEYNEICKKEVLKYTSAWNIFTEKMGYWIDTQNAYQTCDDKYISKLWGVIRSLYNKNLIYKDFSIQPYSPMAGTGLSTHELNQPGAYKEISDTAITVAFKISKMHEAYALVWTTTPWTLPANICIAFNKNFEYAFFNVNFNGKKSTFIAEKTFGLKLFGEDSFLNIIETEKLLDLTYEQLFDFEKLDNHKFCFYHGDFVTSDAGTGFVHIAPSFGNDDSKLAKNYNLPTITHVDSTGKLKNHICDNKFIYKNEPVKEQYLTEDERTQLKEIQDNVLNLKTDRLLSLDERIALKLKFSGHLFKKEVYKHSYPHCWRTDKPIIYYPLDSWFIKVKENRDKLIELNKKINWNSNSVGQGRFGQWLENAVDWNISRSRFWGTPLPIWRSKDGTEEICIGSIEELKGEIEKTGQVFSLKELHRPYIDSIVLISKTGKKLYRELDIIDVWFDSGAMPFASDDFEEHPVADFIAEGIDQTRGWFYTLHVLSCLLNDDIAAKNIIATGLVLDKNGQKMSKRLGNSIDPMELMDKVGADPIRWYLVSTSKIENSVKFDKDGPSEINKNVFIQFYNIFSFYLTYSEIDNWECKVTKPQDEMDEWIISKLATLNQEVKQAYESFNLNIVTEKIQHFIDLDLSNWYIRLNRKRFWENGNSSDKDSAYFTLYTCIENLCKLMAPIAPFSSEYIFKKLTNKESVHLEQFPDLAEVNKKLEFEMQLAADLVSGALSMRAKNKIRIRQPLSRLLVSVSTVSAKAAFDKYKNIILAETNCKSLIFNPPPKTKLQPNFKELGKIFGKDTQNIANLIKNDKYKLENNYIIINYCEKELTLPAECFNKTLETKESQGVFFGNDFTATLDCSLTEDLLLEGFARDFVSIIQAKRKNCGFEITDNICIRVKSENYLIKYKDYIESQTMSKIIFDEVQIEPQLEGIIK